MHEGSRFSTWGHNIEVYRRGDSSRHGKDSNHGEKSHLREGIDHGNGGKQVRRREKSQSQCALM